MHHTGLVASALACSFVVCASAAQPMVDWTNAQFVREFPGLSVVKFAASQDGLEPLLRATGAELSGMLSRLPAVSAIEDVHLMRFRGAAGFDSDRRVRSRYDVRARAGSGVEPIEEMHESASWPDDFLVSTDFLWLTHHFLPRYQPQVRFRYLGRDSSSGAEADVVVFAARPEMAQVKGLFEGMAWIDAASHRILRLRARLQSGHAGPVFERMNVDVQFAVTSGSLWLPVVARVTGEADGMEFYNVHRFAGYRSGSGPLELTAEAPAGERDEKEALVEGIVALRSQKPDAAVGALRDAVRLDPAPAEPHYQLGVALHLTHDLPGAEQELREVVKRAPDIAVGHTELAAVLFERGDMAGTVAQFREIIRLDPKDASAHANLGEALVRLGDRKTAVEEYRIAASIVPDNAEVKARYEALQRPEPAAAVMPEARIRVDVRQVLVPVIVTDRDKHEVVGLHQSDFHVFEDGVEQKISAFTMERTDEGVRTEAAAKTAEAPAPVPVTVTAAPVPSRTYLICIDALHATSGNYSRVRDALTKLFRQEESGNAWYALALTGNQFEIVEQPTQDTSKILAAIASQKLWTAVAGSRSSSDRIALDAFSRRVEETRMYCDSGDQLAKMKCESGKRLLPLQANTLTEQSKLAQLDFLRQLRGVVEQMALMPSRRTLVLISEGFLLNPGLEFYGLLTTYFPEIRDTGFAEAGLRSVERLQADFETVVRLASRHNIPIYAVDSRGVYASSFYDASNKGGGVRESAVNYTDRVQRESANALAEVAAATGGMFINNTNDLFGGLERVIADGRTRYVLGYVPANDTLDGKFRAITVKVGDAKLNVRAKRGYWATQN